jgi:hypothetical protein
MKHLQFPFAETVTLVVKNGKARSRIECELASSEIEIYQSLAYRSKKDFTKPLALVFSSPTVQYLSKQSFDFSLVQVNVDYRSNLVKKVLHLAKSGKSSGSYIQAFSEFSLVLLIPIGHALIKEIVLDESKITIAK